VHTFDGRLLLHSRLVGEISELVDVAIVSDR
jgi:hypothetical protein